MSEVVNTILMTIFFMSLVLATSYLWTAGKMMASVHFGKNNQKIICDGCYGEKAATYVIATLSKLRRER